MNIPSIASRLTSGCYIHFNLDKQTIFVTEGCTPLNAMMWPTNSDNYTCLLIDDRGKCFELAGLIAGISGFLIGSGEETQYGIRYPVIQSNA